MKIFVLIIGIVMAVAGLCLTIWTWYDAIENNRISEASAYAGPVLLVLGVLRMLRAAVAGPLPSFARIAVVGVAILLGYGNSAAVKSIFTQATPEVTTTNY